MNQTQTNRIEVVDALRGLALCAIVIVHCFEHYNLYYIPENAPQWLTALDKEVWNTTWFLLAGKASEIMFIDVRSNSGKRLFTGRVDRQVAERSQEGRIMTITARSSAAVLVDNM